MLAELNALYVTYLATILGFSLSGSKRNTSGTHRQGLFVVAFVCSIIWNLAVSSFIVRLALLHGKIEDAIKDVGYVGPLLSWIVAPIMASYLFRSSDHKE